MDLSNFQALVLLTATALLLLTRGNLQVFVVLVAVIMAIGSTANRELVKEIDTFLAIATGIGCVIMAFVVDVILHRRSSSQQKT